MSLFPAYATVDDRPSSNIYETEDGSRAAVEFMETQLLASDEEMVTEAGVKDVTVTDPVPGPLYEDFYLDTKLDPGNLCVSTLYYPGRPHYISHEKIRPRARLRRRYYEEIAIGDGDDEAEVASRIAAYRRMLADAPCDEDLWLRFIDFQERWRGGDSAVLASLEAAERLPQSRRLRHARLALAARHLPADAHLTLLRDQIAHEKSPGWRLELWVRLLTALAGSASACSAASLAAAARGATGDLRAYPAAYPHIFYTYGAFLRSAGLWEQLVLLIELVMAMNYPPSPGFPPQMDASRREAIDSRLRDKEDKTIMSGMPLSAVWARVERARAAAHWRPADGSDAAELAADPQRAPLTADVADMLQPVAEPRAALLLLVQALRLAKVPLLPASAWLSRAAGGAARAAFLSGGWAAGGGEALLPLLRAARRLPPAHPAHLSHPALAAGLVAHFLDPPHYFVDDSGYLSWVSSLWDACCGWAGAGGGRGVALVCWRLRWMHALMLRVDPQEESGLVELRRVRSSARALLRRWSALGALPFAQFARLELVAGGRPAARSAAIHAYRAAARDRGTSQHTALYIARIVTEVCSPGDPAATWAVCSVALAAPLPTDEQLLEPPPADILQKALLKCEEKCDEIERDEALQRDETDDSTDELCAAMLPSVGEWAAARAQLAPPSLRATLFTRTLQACSGASEPTRYWEHAACALVVASAADHRGAHYARALAPYFPDNAFLSLTASGAPLWSWDSLSAEARLSAGGPPSTDVAALCAVLGALVRAGPPASWTAGGAARLARAARRAARGGAGGALLQAVRMEAEARKDRPDPERALLAALDAQPHAKWLYVRGAQWCTSSAGALPDVLLDKQLRLHALRDELEPVAPPPPTIT